jgi:hypothetical protein
MRTAFGLLASLPFLACSASVASAPAQSSFIRALTPDEFARAGLNKFTAEELSFLEAALAQHQRGIVQAAPGKPAEAIIQATDKSAAAFGAEQVAEVKRLITEQELHARIEGTLESFLGRAVFVLDNGQIWQQRIPDTVYLTPKLVNPEVITRGFDGYKMFIMPANRFVFVKRIQ